MADADRLTLSLSTGGDVVIKLRPDLAPGHVEEVVKYANHKDPNVAMAARAILDQFKTPPAVQLLKRAAGVEKGSAKPNREKVGRITRSQVRQIVDAKSKDLNANDTEAAMKMIEGTARSMGLEVVE